MDEIKVDQSLLTNDEDINKKIYDSNKEIQEFIKKLEKEVKDKKE